MVKELTDLTLTDLIKEYKRSFVDYWEMHDEAVKEFRRRHIERVLEAERTEVIGCGHYERTETRPLLGEGVSAQTISNIAKSLDEDVRRYHNRRIEDKYLYLFLDGITLKRKRGFGSRKKVVLVAYGITINGKRELIDFMVIRHETERIKVRTTNVIERAFREVRRRTRPMSCFNNLQSIERIVYAVITHLNDQWRTKTIKEFAQKN